MALSGACIRSGRDELVKSINSLLNMRNDLSGVETQIIAINSRVTTLENTKYAGTHIGQDMPTDNSNLWVDTTGAVTTVFILNSSLLGQSTLA